MQYKELEKLLNFAKSKGLVPLLIGPTGVGKTEMVKLYAKKHHLKLFYLDIPTLSPQDLGIMPIIDSNRKSFNYALPTWAVEAIQNKNTLIFLDEINRGDRDMMNACLQIVTGFVAGEKIKGFVVAACNINTDDVNEQYYVNEMDSSFYRRFFKITIMPNYEEFKTFFKRLYPNSIMLKFLETEMLEGRNLFMTKLEHGYNLSPYIIEMCEKIISDKHLTMDQKLKSLKDNVGYSIAESLKIFLENNYVTLQDILNVNPTVLKVEVPILVRALCNAIRNHQSLELFSAIDKILSNIDLEKHAENTIALFEQLMKILPNRGIYDETNYPNIVKFINYFIEAYATNSKCA